MRALPLLAVLLAGCPVSGTTGDCQQDSQCGGGVCGRDHLCYPAADIRAVKVQWTISGAVASPTTCNGVDLYIRFHVEQSGESLGYAPVPCFAGAYSIDKLPLQYSFVELGVHNADFQRTSGPITADGTVQLDLPAL